MIKKRGKPKSSISSKKYVKKVKALKKEAGKAAEAPKPVKDALHELEIIAEEKKVERKINDVEKEEEEIEKKETEIASEEKKIEKETEKVEKLEKEIKKEVIAQPLTKLNIKDLNKGIVGAFIGVVAHYAFIYGKALAQYISTTRATLLFVFSYLLIIILMYETGYRDIKEKRLLGILPRRATVIYATSLIVIIVIFFLFNMINLSSLTNLSSLATLYKEMAVTSVLASVGAGTADLIGKD